jgi:hypothetical protein
MGMPIACEYGKDCFISSLFSYEENIEEGLEKIISDYKCGQLTQKGEKSTRFALRNMQQIQNGEGINVIAVDKGTVEAIHDGEKDMGASKAAQKMQNIANCGNGVLIRHGRGFITQYCHLQQGSVSVEAGQEVKKGDVIGKVGSSGFVSYPHLEFIVKRDDQPIDPFTGEGITSCQQKKDFISLWDFKTDALLSYVPTLLINASFTGNIPNAEGVQNSRFISDTLPNDENRLVFWVNLMGLRKDDILQISITSPSGDTIALREKTFSRYEPLYFHYVGKRRTSAAWERGTYIGNISLSRLKESENDKTEKAKNNQSKKETLGRNTKKIRAAAQKTKNKSAEMPEELGQADEKNEASDSIKASEANEATNSDTQEKTSEDRYLVIYSHVELIVE